MEHKPHLTGPVRMWPGCRPPPPPSRLPLATLHALWPLHSTKNIRCLAHLKIGARWCSNDTGEAVVSLDSRMRV